MSDITANRHKGAETSKDAYNRIKASLPKARRWVYSMILQRPVKGFTVHEIALRLDVSPNVISGRLTELKRDRLIEANGERRGNAAVLIPTKVVA
jgi:DNA-binding IscR family transcriptional regulator